MRLPLIPFLIAYTQAIAVTTSTHATQGLYNLVKRRLPSHHGQLVFLLDETIPPSSSKLVNDHYSISTHSNGSIAVAGNTLSALSTGLRRYLTEVAGVDVYWFIQDRLDEVVSPLPPLRRNITGASIVPWRYYFNTVTFSYTTPFWTWSDWERELDWLALHGVNLALAWVGFEKILLDVFQSINLTTSEILPFFSGPAFQAWNRFGNIQGSWGGELPSQWVDSQFELQQKILERMLELGITPILPAFTGFVPRALLNVFPNATVVNGSRWEDFLIEYTNTTFLEPSDPLFAELQSRVISRQIETYGNITKFYTLDQYNENDPFSGDLDYLRNVTHSTWQSLKAANPAAVWVMQGWLFTSNADFWTNERIEAYLAGVKEDQDMLILDLFSESEPQWQRTNSYYGKPWIWNMLHNYGGNMGLYGQITNVTVNPIEALGNSSSLVGFGLTPESQAGNEIMYKLLLAQAWQSTAINTSDFFEVWTSIRYAGRNSTVPAELYTAWQLLRTSAYNNTNLTSNAVSKAIYELAPNTTRLVNRTGHHPTTIHYDPRVVVQAWTQMYKAASCEPALWSHPAYTYDLVDLTRQVYANAFLASYTSLIATWNTSNATASPAAAQPHISTLITLLRTLDPLLSTLPQFSLAPWIASARAQAPSANASTTTADFFEYNARNQVTQWGPDGEILDYASKSWGGLVREYYLPRWEAFLAYLGSVGPGAYKHSVARASVKDVEVRFQRVGEGTGEVPGSVRGVIEGIVVPALKGIGVIGEEL